MIELPLYSRLAPVGTIDADKRTAEVIFTTGATVRRRSYEGLFDEVLVVSPEAINLDRLLNGAPLLDSHDRYSLANVLGVVEGARVEGGKGLASVRFPAAGISADVDRVFGMVRDGILRNISVGYSIDRVRLERSTEKAGVDQWIVERWTPNEISLVTVPADFGAQVRAEDNCRKYPVEMLFADAGAARARMRMRQAGLIPA